MAPEMILASASPRRRELLSDAGITLKVITADVDESLMKESVTAAARRLARKKAVKVYRSCPEAKGKWILAADTLVARGATLMGKPKDRAEAAGMLRSLAGRSHKVVSGAALISPKGKVTCFHAVTRVRFRPLNQTEIQNHLNHNEWQDAAGAYKIQEKGKGIVASVRGSLTNVVGLPLEKVIKKLKQNRFFDSQPT